MTTVTRRWQLLPHDPQAAARLAGPLGVSPVVAQLLINRGVAEVAAAKVFLECPLNALHSPQLLPDIGTGVDRVAAALLAKGKICVYGDYDVDGVSGTSILVRLFRMAGGDVRFYVPRRLEEGYGLNVAALRKLAADGVRTVVTVDCGVTAVEEAAEAKRLGIDLVVTDHHVAKDELPAAAALVHPGLPGGAYPFAGLSGSAVAFKFAWAVARRLSEADRVAPVFREFLLDAVALAALGVVADVVPLIDENRILVHHGLKRLREQPLVGLRALLQVAELDGRPLRAEDIAFRLGPRLNAAGRLGCADLAVEMLTTPSPADAMEAAEFLEQKNKQRQEMERETSRQAKEMVADLDPAATPAVVLAGDQWHPGVIGIVAGRLADRLGRPALVIAVRDGEAVAVGSGRSAGGLELHKALAACGGHLVSHGGHAAAAGFKIEPAHIDAFREAFCEYAAGHFPQGTPPPPELRLDAEVPLSALTPALLRDIDRLEPYGAGNPRPRFLAAGLRAEGPRRMGKDERHLSFKVRQGETVLRAVAWNMGERLDELFAAGGDCCLAFTPRVNHWNGETKVEMEVADFQPAADATLG